jgi:hypothetical protein
MSNKKLLIITGPQGSGNHIFSRLFSLHEEVAGWDELLDTYWVPSDQEPFAEYWVKPETLTPRVFEDKQYHMANVSCPFFYDGVRYVPKILEVAERVKSFGIDVVIGIVVRDQNINKLQQMRVRKEHTLPIAQDYYYNTLLQSNLDVHFLDHEAFFLHKEHYLKWVSKVLDFPVAYDSPDILKFITTDANHKYVNYVEEYWLDEKVAAGCQPDLTQRKTDQNH